VYELTEDEQAEFRASCEDLHQRWRELIGPDLYDMSAEYIATLG